MDQWNISSDYMEYWIYNANETTLRMELVEFEKSFKYMYHNEPFQLEMVPGGLYGKTVFRDCIDDEWYLTFVLFEISKKFPDLIIETVDIDGQFLLIEAAAYLPKWLSEETSSHRVFIRNGKVVLIDKVPRMEMSVDKALVILQEKEYWANAEIQKVIQDKLKEYPGKIEENKHVIRVIVPVAIAQLLALYPQHLSLAVEAFYYRIPLDASKVFRKMNTFNVKDQVHTMVTFTRCLYGMLKQQEFYPPKEFETSVLPLMQSEHYDLSAAMMGMKITCGFELLYSNAKNLDDRVKFNIDKVLSSKLNVDLFPQSATWTDDDDSWMEIEPTSLEAYLNSNKCDLKDDDLEDENRNDENKNVQNVKLDNVAGMMNSFMETESGYQGVDTLQDDSSDEEMELDFDVFMDILSGKQDSNEKEDKMVQDLCKQMDTELELSNVRTKDNSSVDDGEKPLQDLTLVSNLLESLASQQGLAGPVSNILGDMGIQKENLI